MMWQLHMYRRLKHKTSLHRDTVAYIHMVSLNEQRVGASTDGSGIKGGTTGRNGGTFLS